MFTKTPLLRGAAFVLLLMTTQAATAQQAKISGYMFGDAYAVAAHEDEAGFDEEDLLQGNTGLWFRRIYLTFDFQLDEAWKVRLRSEMNSPGDFTTRSALEPSAKDAYVQWKKDQHQVRIGLSGTPTWGVVEEVWGYRSVEKTLLDLQRIGSSRDIGIALKGSLDSAKKIRYNLMFANGGGTRSEVNKGKKVLASIGLRPTSELVLELYTDYEDRPGATNRFTIQGFVGLQKKNGRLGIQFVHQQREVENGENVELNGFSIFGAVRLTDKMHGFARFDKMLDANPDADRIAYLPFYATHKSNFLLLGVDIQPIEQVHFMPNIEVIFYDEMNGNAPSATIMPRMTFFVTFG